MKLRMLKNEAYRIPGRQTWVQCRVGRIHDVPEPLASSWVAQGIAEPVAQPRKPKKEQK